MHGALSEKTSLLTVLKEKEIMIDSTRRQLAQTKEDLGLKEQELDSVMRRATAEDKDRSLLERKEKTRIHKELETLEKNYADLAHQRKADLSMKQAELDAAHQQIQSLEELKTKHLLNIDQLEMTFRDMKKKFIAKSDAYDALEKEYTKLQDRFRDTANVEFNLATVKEQ